MLNVKDLFKNFRFHTSKCFENNLTEEKALQSKLTQIIITSIDPEELKNKIIREIAITLYASRCFFIEYDLATNNFKKVKNSYAAKREEASMLGFDIETDVPILAMKQKYMKSIIIQDTRRYIQQNNLQGSKEEVYFNKYNIKAYLSVRLEFSENFLGVFVVQYDKLKPYGLKSHLEFLKDIAEHISIALYLSSLYVKEKTQREKEQLLKSVILIISENVDLNITFSKVFEILGSIFNAKSIFINTDIEKNKKVYTDNKQATGGNAFAEAYIYNFPEFDEIKNKINYVPNTANFIIQNNLENSFIEKHFQKQSIKSLVLLPIVYKNESFGSTVIYFDRLNPVTKDDLEFIKAITSQLAIAIKQYLDYQTQEKIARREKFLREMILMVRKLENHNEIYDYLLNNILELFKCDCAYHLHYSIRDELIIKNEFAKDSSIRLIDKVIPDEISFNDILLNSDEDVAVINNVEVQISNQILKDFLINNNIRSFLIYSVDSNIYPDEDEKTIATTIIATQTPRDFSIDEVKTFKLIVDATNAVYRELRINKETEQIKQNFLATLTHDLRSPINAEQKALEAIISGKLGKSLDDFCEYLEDIYKTNGDLLRIVNNILSVYHYESGKYELKFEPCNVDEIINAAVRPMKHLAKDYESEIVVYLEDNLPLVFADRNEINRVLVNLINNAIKHNQKNTTIDIKAFKQNRNVVISVKDNGKGISETERSKIFQRYPAEKRKIGTGLGLYLSKQIIDAHNEKIWFETEENKGISFYFTLQVYQST